MTTESSQQHALTARQLQVLSLVAEGHPAKVVADKLTLSVGAVEMHMGRVLRTLSARNQAHAVAIAFRKGVLT